MTKLSKSFPFVDVILKGFSQIMLRENSLTGLFFLCGLFVGSWQCGAGAILSAVAGTCVAKMGKYPTAEINSGLYGFSAALVGIALTFFFKADWMIWILVWIGGMSAAMLQRFFILRAFPAYTLPFILIAWVLIYLVRLTTDIPASDLFLTDTPIGTFPFWSAISNGFGQVMFQGKWLAGLLCLFGMLVSGDLRFTLTGLVGSVLGITLAFMLHQDTDSIYSGLWGYNAILTAIVLTDSGKSSILWVISGVFVTVLIHFLLIKISFIGEIGGVLTFPFVAGTWMILLGKKALKFI